MKNSVKQKSRSPLLAQGKTAVLQRCEMERMTGVEPAFKAWEAFVLPMNYIRSAFCAQVVSVSHDGDAREPCATKLVQVMRSAAAADAGIAHLLRHLHEPADALVGRWVRGEQLRESARGERVGDHHG